VNQKPAEIPPFIDELPELDFQEFPKMARLNRDVVITEKIDGTNAQILIVPVTAENNSAVANPGICLCGDFLIRAGSRNRWLASGKQDNAGFAAWVSENRNDLVKLGPGRHFGEWWGRGIQRNYGLDHRRFSLFNVGRWYIDADVSHYPGEEIDRWGRDLHNFPRVKIFSLETNANGGTTTVEGPQCCHVVPTLWRGNFHDCKIERSLDLLRRGGSLAAPGFAKAEGIVIYHEAAKKCFKVTLENDESPKSLVTPGT